MLLSTVPVEAHLSLAPWRYYDRCHCCCWRRRVSYARFSLTCICLHICRLAPNRLCSLYSPYVSFPPSSPLANLEVTAVKLHDFVGRVTVDKRYVLPCLSNRPALFTHSLCCYCYYCCLVHRRRKTWFSLDVSQLLRTVNLCGKHHLRPLKYISFTKLIAAPGPCVLC